MPRLPDYTELGERPAPRVSGNVVAFEPTRVNADGLSVAGRDLDVAAAIIDETNEQQDRLLAQDGVNRLQQARLELEYGEKAGFRNVKERGVVEGKFIDDYMGKFDESASGVRDSLRSERAKRMFDERSQVANLQYRSALLQHQAEETNKFNDSTDNARIELALKGMAQRPTDELGFQTGLAQVFETIDGAAKRKGMSEVQTKLVKGKYVEAAYSARIMSILDGIPGAVQSNPYLAEKMYDQVRDKFGPETQYRLGQQVLRGIKGVQSRDLAKSLVSGSNFTDPKALYPAIDGVTPLADVVQHLESRGRRYDDKGNLLQGPMTRTGERAQGEMQVMPTTITDPGFGVVPAKDNSPAEIARVGRDYIGAMAARYDNPALALAAYNAGPGTVDEWIAKYGDPRTGEVSLGEWVEKIPFAETRKYVQAGLAKVAPQAAPTARELKTELPALMARAEELWLRMYPGDQQGADAASSRVAAYGNQMLQATQAQQGAAFDYVLRQMMSGAKSLDDVTGTPEGKQAWDRMTPEGQYSLTQRFKRTGSELTAEAFNTYYELLGMAGNEPEKFVKEDLSKHFGKMPDNLLLGLANAQKSINSKDASQQAKDLNWQKAKSNVEDMLKPLKLGGTAKTTNEKALTERFYGQLNESMQGYFDQNKKWPDTQETRKIAAGLLVEGKIRRDLLWNSTQRAFEAEDLSKFYVPLPNQRSPEYTVLINDYEAAFGRKPTAPELQRWYTMYKMSGRK